MKNSCHKDYTNQRRLDNFLKKKVANDQKTARQSIEQFDWKKQCFYCGADTIKDKETSGSKYCSSRNDPSFQKQHLEVMRTETQ